MFGLFGASTLPYFISARISNLTRYMHAKEELPDFPTRIIAVPKVFTEYSSRNHQTFFE